MCDGDSDGDSFFSGSYLNTAGLQRARRVNHSSKHNRSVSIKGRADSDGIKSGGRMRSQTGLLPATYPVIMCWTPQVHTITHTMPSRTII